MARRCSPRRTVQLPMVPCLTTCSTRAAVHLTLPALPIRVERRDRAARLVES